MSDKMPSDDQASTTAERNNPAEVETILDSSTTVPSPSLIPLHSLTLADNTGTEPMRNSQENSTIPATSDISGETDEMSSVTSANQAAKTIPYTSDHLLVAEDEEVEERWRQEVELGIAKDYWLFNRKPKVNTMSRFWSDAEIKHRQEWFREWQQDIRNSRMTTPVAEDEFLASHVGFDPHLFGDRWEWIAASQEDAEFVFADTVDVLQEELERKGRSVRVREGTLTSHHDLLFETVGKGTTAPTDSDDNKSEVKDPDAMHREASSTTRTPTLPYIDPPNVSINSQPRFTFTDGRLCLHDRPHNAIEFWLFYEKAKFIEEVYSWDEAKLQETLDKFLLQSDSKEEHGDLEELMLYFPPRPPYRVPRFVDGTYGMDRMIRQEAQGIVAGAMRTYPARRGNQLRKREEVLAWLEEADVTTAGGEMRTISDGAKEVDEDVVENQRSKVGIAKIFSCSAM